MDTYKTNYSFCEGALRWLEELLSDHYGNKVSINKSSNLLVLNCDLFTGSIIFDTPNPIFIKFGSSPSFEYYYPTKDNLF